MFNFYKLLPGKEYYRATFAVTQDLSLNGLIRNTAPFTRLVWQDKGIRDPDPIGSNVQENVMHVVKFQQRGKF